MKKRILYLAILFGLIAYLATPRADVWLASLFNAVAGGAPYSVSLHSPVTYPIDI